MKTATKFSLFSIIDQAKKLGFYPLANLAFVALVDVALDYEKQLHFIWESAENEEDIYFDLLVVSDGIRSACIPAPLLAKPQVFRSLCKKEVELKKHNRDIDNNYILSVDLNAKLEELKQQILSICPNAQKLANQFLVNKECQICLFYNEEFNLCSVNPCGYPQDLCDDFEVDFQIPKTEKRIEIAKHLQNEWEGFTILAQVERTGESRRIIMPSKNMKFHEIPWDSLDYTLSGSRYDHESFSVVKSDGNPQWVWYYVSQQLESLKDEEARWLIGKGCDSSSCFEVWIIKDSRVKVNVKQKPKHKPKADSLWLPTVLDEFKPSNNYAYVSSEDIRGKWGSEKAVPFKNLVQTCDVIQSLSGKEERWLVWNKVANCFDVLRKAY